MKRALLPFRVASIISKGLHTHSTPQLRHCCLTNSQACSMTSNWERACEWRLSQIISHGCTNITPFAAKASIHVGDSSIPQVHEVSVRLFLLVVCSATLSSLVCRHYLTCKCQEANKTK